MISVCIATYNGQKYIKEQVDSIISQLAPSDEIIVSDDESTDNTIAILKQFNDQRIIVIENNNRKGVVGNFENALNHATGEYIFLADQDDVWHPNKVKICLEYLQNNDCILHDAQVVDENLTETTPSFFKQRNTKLGYWNNIYINGFVGCCMAFNRKLLNKILPFPNNIAMHDIWIGLIASKKYKVELIHKPLIKFRRHSSNTSCTAGKSNLSLWSKIQYRVIMLKTLLK